MAVNARPPTSVGTRPMMSNAPSVAATSRRRRSPSAASPRRPREPRSRCAGRASRTSGRENTRRVSSNRSIALRKGSTCCLWPGKLPSTAPMKALRGRRTSLSESPVSDQISVIVMKWAWQSSQAFSSAERWGWAYVLDHGHKYKRCE